jgi:small subunit ribosomal protein S6
LSEAARQYELVLMLDLAVEEEGREKIVSDTRSSIEAAGTLLHEDNWGVREMAYEINHKSESEYRWLRFEAPTPLLDDLDHNLKIADGVMRFRIFRVDPSDPVLPAPPATSVIMAPTGDDDDRPRRRSRDY